TTTNRQQFELLRGLPFYDWSDASTFTQNVNSSTSSTFNYALGLPQKDGQSYPLFDYEQMLFDTLQSNKHTWIKKATGIGVTEFMLRYMAWLCFQHSNKLENSQMCIVTGPRIELAITLIDRIKGLFRNIFQKQFDTKETVIELNGVHIQAYPSHHLDSMRGLTNVSFIYLD
ncbi:MAG: hypothetical protein ACRD8Z_05425, partial [Nitrososphaeraceae archaeon]